MYSENIEKGDLMVSFFFRGKWLIMSQITDKGIYYAKNDFYQLIREVGGVWNDAKFRPLVTLIPSSDHPEIYWAIPMGDYEHRDDNAKKRIRSFLDRGSKDISSCFYHIGRTDKKTIFFISDAVPITLQYIEREYLVGPKSNARQYVIKNKTLISELERKLGRIISFEKDYSLAKGHPKFRQCMLSIHERLVSDLAVRVQE